MTDENIRAIPADEPMSWGDRERVYQNDMMLAFTGSGFVTAASGRVFIPLVGGPKSVPSRKAERDLAVLRQRHWARKLGIAIFVVGTVWLFTPSSFVSFDELAVVAFSAALGTACLLEWRQTRTWAGASGLQSSRFEIIVWAMSNWPSTRLLIKLVAEFLVGGFILFAMDFFGLADGPSLQGKSAANLAALALVLSLYAFFGFRWCCMFIALRRRARQPA